MDKVCLIGGLRSYIGLTGGVYKHVPAELLGAAVLKAVTEKYEVMPQQIICGNGVGAGGNIARLAAFEAGLPESIPAVSVDVQCGSGLEAVAMAAAKIEAGEAEVIIAGGFESTSTQPRRGYNANHPDYKGEETYSVAKFMPGIHRETVMLEGAELTAEREHISRAESDPWVLRSHKLAAQAAADGALSDIIVPCFGAVRDEGTTVHYIPVEYPAVADRHVVAALAQAAQAAGLNFAEGISQSKDSFYGEVDPACSPAEKRLKERWEAWRRGNVMCSEMECAALFVISSIRGCRAGAIMNWGDMNRTIQTACDAVRLLIQRDKIIKCERGKL